MRRTLSIALAFVTALSVLAFGGCDAVEPPEERIIGMWKSDDDLFFLEFKEDGTVSGKLDLPIINSFDLKGTYTVTQEKRNDADVDVLVLSFSLWSISYNPQFDFTFKKNKDLNKEVLTLNGKFLQQDISLTFYRDLE